MIKKIDQVQKCQSNKSALRWVPIFCLILMLLIDFQLKETLAGSVIQIDPYPLNGTRKIPDMTGGIGDSVTLNNTLEVIDILILGDGYLAGESTTFVNDAKAWYNYYFVSSPGLRPFTFFPQAFRVRAIWEVSNARADTLQNSHYRVILNTKGDLVSTTDDDTKFRDSLFKSIDALPAPKNATRYPATLDNQVDGQQIIKPMADVYSNLYIVLKIKNWLLNSVSGYAATTPRNGGPDKVRVGLGENSPHEFGHTFGYLADEYIDVRGTAADPDFRNPTSAEMSVFNLSNLTYSNERCDLLWTHLAPGGKYNPNLFSLLGNLFVGGNQEDGVWHSEYECLINGTHQNYFCDFVPDSVRLRDDSHYCFWCEELFSLRILERTGELKRDTDPADINDKGKVWFQLWDDSLRDKYYTYFNVKSLIVQRDSCFALAASGGCSTCSTACDETDDSGMPSCLFECDIREVGNALYVDGVAGSDLNTGKKFEPKKTILGGVTAACGSLDLVMIKPASYPAVTITQKAILIPEGCSPVVIGSGAAMTLSTREEVVHEEK